MDITDLHECADELAASRRLRVQIYALTSWDDAIQLAGSNFAPDERRGFLLNCLRVANNRKLLPPDAGYLLVELHHKLNLNSTAYDLIFHAELAKHALLRLTALIAANWDRNDPTCVAALKANYAEFEFVQQIYRMRVSSAARDAVSFYLNRMLHILNS